MAENVLSSMVLFVVALMIAAVAAAAMGAVTGQFAGELRERGRGLSDALGTDLAVVNDPDNVPYNGVANELTIYVKNTGSTELFAQELLVLVDGQHRSFTSTLLEGATAWTTGTVMELTVSVTLASGDHTVRVIHTPSVGDDLHFRI